MARILLAEDDPSMRGFLARALIKAGHVVVDVADGEAAMSCLVNGEFDLLLADIVMPGINGIDLAKHAKDDAPKLKIMLITGFAAVALKARSELDPAAKVLSKPFHLNSLVDEVDKLLAA
ncbi:MAG: response regulator [Proteobacteria bacterium]|nr:response regulator [Pseudomonadota bacterium]